MSDFEFNFQTFGKKSEQTPPPELGRVSFDDDLHIDVSTIAEERFPHGKYLKTSDGKNEYILDENGRTILLFEGQAQGGFSSVYSPLSKEQLTRELLALPQEQHEELRSRLGLPEPTQRDMDEFQEIQKRRAKETELLEAALELPTRTVPSRERQEVDQQLVRGVIQKEYAITNAKSNEPIIGTFGLGPCIAVTVYDAETQTAAVAHVDGTTRVDSLARIIDEFEDRSRIRVGLIGGDGSSRKQAIQMIQFFQNMGINLDHADILSKSHPTAFVIDSRTGDITPNITPINNGEAEDLRMQAAGLQMDAQIKKEFDGRE